jgi:hypothetical protein
MKMPMVGIVAVAILVVVAGIGFGIAQAAGMHSEQPVLSFVDQEVTRVANSSAEEKQLAAEGKEFVPEGNWAGTDWQGREPVETGAIPAPVLEESWMQDYGND